jgi:hypothetical protein
MEKKEADKKVGKESDLQDSQRLSCKKRNKLADHS